MKHMKQCAALLSFAAACTSAGPEADGKDDVALGDGKADGGGGGYSAAEIAGAVRVANTLTLNQLDHDVGLDSRAAKNIIAHRAGADGQLGTADDDLFDDGAELDAVPYVGPIAFEKLVAYAQTQGWIATPPWEVAIAHANVTSVVVATDGTIVVAGSATAALSGQPYGGATDGFLRAYDPEGNELWTRQFGGPKNQAVNGLSIRADGTIAVVGSTEENLAGWPAANNGNGAFIQAYDLTGKRLWSHGIVTGAASTAEAAYGVSFAPDGSIVVVGKEDGLVVESGVGIVGGGTVPLLVKYDAAGDQMWSRHTTFQASSYETWQHISIDGSGDVVTLGTAQNTASVLNPYEQGEERVDQLDLQTGAVQTGGSLISWPADELSDSRLPQGRTAQRSGVR